MSQLKKISEEISNLDTEKPIVLNKEIIELKELIDGMQDKLTSYVDSKREYILGVLNFYFDRETFEVLISDSNVVLDVFNVVSLPNVPNGNAHSLIMVNDVLGFSSLSKEEFTFHLLNNAIDKKNEIIFNAYLHNKSYKQTFIYILDSLKSLYDDELTELVNELNIFAELYFNSKYRAEAIIYYYKERDSIKQ